MCGKFSGFVSWRSAVRYADLILGGQSGDDELILSTPMRLTPIVCLAPDGRRAVVPMRWGWVDASDPLRKPGLMHARGETADAKPTWKFAFAHNRGVTFVNTFNVGEDIAPGRVKQWTCRRADGNPLAIAVIWERWEHPQHGALHVYVPVTTFSPPIVHTKDDRFPVLLDNDADIALWLGETGAPLEEIKTLVRVYGGELIVEEEKKPDVAKPAKAARVKDTAQASLF
jgi:putative SOS response-associated peptidase YedK